MSAKKFLLNDRKHTSETSKRWSSGKITINRDMNSNEYLENYDEWIIQQCFSCQYYVELKGILGSDWGACTNSVSISDGSIMYEHDGCEYHSFAKDEQEM